MSRAYSYISILLINQTKAKCSIKKIYWLKRMIYMGLIPGRKQKQKQTCKPNLFTSKFLNFLWCYVTISGRFFFISDLFKTPKPQPPAATVKSELDVDKPVAQIVASLQVETDNPTLATEQSSKPLDPWQRAKLAKLPRSKENDIIRAVAYHIIDDMRLYSTISSKSFRYLFLIFTVHINETKLYCLYRFSP